MDIDSYEPPEGSNDRPVIPQPGSSNWNASTPARLGQPRSPVPESISPVRMDTSRTPEPRRKKIIPDTLESPVTPEPEYKSQFARSLSQAHDSSQSFITSPQRNASFVEKTPSPVRKKAKSFNDSAKFRKAKPKPMSLYNQVLLKGIPKKVRNSLSKSLSRPLQHLQTGIDSLANRTPTASMEVDTYEKSEAVKKAEKQLKKQRKRELDLQALLTNSPIAKRTRTRKKSNSPIARRTRTKKK